MTDGERGALEAASSSSGLGKRPQQPCYPEKAVLGTERSGAENSFSIPNCVDEYRIGPDERPVNKLIGEGKAKRKPFS